MGHYASEMMEYDYQDVTCDRCGASQKVRVTAMSPVHETDECIRVLRERVEALERASVEEKP